MSKVSRAAGDNVRMRWVYVLIPFALLLMATLLHQGGDTCISQPTPYQLALPYIVVPMPNPDNNPLTEEGTALGRRLFYDPILSGNNKQSCGSCHQQEKSFTDGNDIAIGSLGKKAHRNSMALINMGWRNKFFWDGRASSLEELIHFPVTDPLEMYADTADVERRLNKDSIYKTLFNKAFGTDQITMPLASKAISQFLRTIVSYNTPFDHVIKDYMLAMQYEFAYNHKIMDDQGLLYEVFGRGNEGKYGHTAADEKMLKQISPDTAVLKVFVVCLTCHYNSFQVMCPTCPSIQLKNNGLETEGKDKGMYQLTGREEDKYRFIVPTFRNLTLTGPYMHDGRFKTLEEVIEHYNSEIQPNENLDPLLTDSDKKPKRFNLTEDEKKQLLGLIKLLTDSSIVTDPRFVAPMRNHNNQ